MHFHVADICGHIWSNCYYTPENVPLYLWLDHIHIIEWWTKDISVIFSDMLGYFTLIFIFISKGYRLVCSDIVLYVIKTRLFYFFSFMSHWWCTLGNGAKNLGHWPVLAEKLTSMPRGGNVFIRIYNMMTSLLLSLLAKKLSWIKPGCHYIGVIFSSCFDQLYQAVCFAHFLSIVICGVQIFHKIM